MKRTSLFLLALLVFAWPVAAQTAPAAPTADPLSTTMKQLFEGVARNVAESAEKTGEDIYPFKPTPEVRSFGEMIGHVADAMFSYCSRSVEKANPMPDVEKTKKTKAELVAALKEARGYCDGVYGSMTDAEALKTIKVGQNEMVRSRLLIANISHVNEHYGNLVTYMRLKGLVPPSTERAQQMRR